MSYSEFQIYEYIDRRKFFDNSKETSFLFSIQGKLIALKCECNWFNNIKLIFPRHLILNL